MRLSGSTQRLELPSATREKLESFRRRIWVVKLAEGVLAATFGLLLSYLLVFLLDRVWDTPGWLRAALLILGATGLAIWLPLKWHRWVWRTRRLEPVARMLKHRFPRLSDQLLGIVELVQSEDEQYSPALCQAALNQVDAQAQQRDLRGAVPSPRHRQWASLTGPALALVAGAFLFVPSAGGNALARWLMPWKNTARYTFAQLDQLPDQLHVPYAEPFALNAVLSKKTAWAPEEGSARYESQQPIRAPRTDNRYEFEVPPQKEDGSLAVSIGDARRSIQVQPTNRPELSAIAARIKLPDYLQYPDEIAQDIRGGSLSVVAGSRVVLEATTSRKLVEATLNGNKQTIRGSKLVTDSILVDSDKSPKLWWRDSLLLSAKEPFTVSMTALEDEAPAVTGTQLARAQVVLDEEVLTFKVNADDDYGVKVVGIEWAGIDDPVNNPHPAKGEKLISAGGPQQRDIEIDATFSPKREGIPPQTLEVRLFATDYLPGRERVYSPTYIMHVLSPEEHAVWLTQQMRQWFRQAQEVYEREQQLHETNQELRQLSEDELDQPDNRRRIENQAAAEQANVRRLSGLTDMGEELIKQATRNDQFHAETLETWARMLQTLQEISANRMPSVADLLRNAASAPASSSKQGKPGQAKPSEAQQSPPGVGVNRDEKSGSGGGQSKPGAPNKVPSISDRESSFDQSEEDPSKTPKPSQSSPGRLGLPSTTVPGGGGKQQEQKQGPARENLDQAVQEQEDLLADFAAVAEELQRILNNLEGSTFVKRLKAAARRQLNVASDLSRSLHDNFGLTAEEVRAATRQQWDGIAEREMVQSDDVYIIQDDLEAYFNRVQHAKYKVVLDEMKDTQVVTRIRHIAETTRESLAGQSIAQAEYWADTLDRWAEELVGPPGQGGGECKGGPGASLPPALVLEVLKILEKEIGLRDETRGLEQARTALEDKDYHGRATPLAGTQLELQERVTQLVKNVVALPDGAANFAKELALLQHVGSVMGEAHELLARPETGAETIAAETEVIELLLQAKRCCSKGGGGGGGASPGGGGGGDTQDSALAQLGEGDANNAGSEVRHISQATGVAGAELPVEFRTGLDAYFSALESDPPVTSAAP